MTHVDRNDLVIISESLKVDIERNMEDASPDYAGIVFKLSRALSNVVSELGHKGLNPFNEQDWEAIVSEE